MKSFCIFIFLLPIFSALAQIRASSEAAKNAVYIEALGIGGYGSLNYERVLFKRNRLDFNIRLGLSTYHTNDFTNRFNPDLIFPLAISALYGHNHHIEIGAGKVISSVVYLNEEEFRASRRLRFNSNVFVGYRYQRNEGGFIYRVTYSPLFTENVRWTWGGVSIGYVF